MNIIKIRVAMVVIVFLLIAQREAAAKASDFLFPVKDLPAIVTMVEEADSPGDADYDIYLRPVDTPREERDRFWNTFWRPTNFQWIDQLADAVAIARTSPFTPQCQACAGSGQEGVECVIDKNKIYESIPCRNLFSCPACIREISASYRASLDWVQTQFFDPSIADFTAKAEVFFGISPNPLDRNEMNDDLRSAMRFLGIPQTCSEIRIPFPWEGLPMEWTPVLGSFCGRRVLLTGVFTLDEEHKYRPEIHPLSSIVVNWDGYKRVGTFIDGSVADFPILPWKFDYRLLPEGLYPSVVSVPLKTLQGPDPTASDPSKLWTPYCYREDKYSFNVLSIDETISNTPGVCPTEFAVSMDRKDTHGAAWVSDLRSGWLPTQIVAHLNVALHLDTPGGILSKGIPQQTTTSAPLPAIPQSSPPIHDSSILPINPSPSVAQGRYISSKASKFLRPDHCEVPPGTIADPELRRWYRWKVSTNSWVSVGIEQPRWQWILPPESVSIPQLPTLVPGGPYEFTLWTSLPQTSSLELPEDLIRVEAKMYRTRGNLLLATSGDSSPIKIPSVRINPSNSRITTTSTTPVYSTNVTADAKGLCGPSTSWKYNWMRNDTSLPLAGAGPHEITLNPKGKMIGYDYKGAEIYGAEELTVDVMDAYGVQVVQGKLVFMAPMFEAEIEPNCAGLSTKSAISYPKGWPPTPFDLPKTQVVPPEALEFCGKVRVVAKVEQGEPIGISFPEGPLEEVKFNWADLKYMSESTNFEWQSLPAEGLSIGRTKYEGDTLVITTGMSGKVWLQASVTVTDRLGRSASANVEFTNDFTPPADIPNVVSKLWMVWRPGKPLPGPLATIIAQKEDTGDPLATEVGILLAQASRTSPSDARRVTRLRQRFENIQRYGFMKVAKERGIQYTVPQRPVFTIRASRPFEPAAKGQVIRGKPHIKTKFIAPSTPAVPLMQSPPIRPVPGP